MRANCSAGARQTPNGLGGGGKAISFIQGRPLTPTPLLRVRGEGRSIQFFWDGSSRPASFLMMDVALLGRLVDEHGPALTLYARQWTDVPEDVVQEAFVKLVGQARAPERIVAWLYRVVRNGAVSAARARLRRFRHEATAAE